MTSKQIVERLINEHFINGEEAYILINDIVKSETYNMGKTLEDAKPNSSIKWFDIPSTFNTGTCTTGCTK